MIVKSKLFFSHSLFSSIATPSFSSKRFFSIAKASAIMGSSQKPVILQTVPMLPDLQQALDSKFEHLRLWEAQDKKAFVAQNAHKIRGIVGNAEVGADREIIDALPNLEIVSSFSVGLDKIDLARCKERGIMVTNTPDVLTDETADTAMALLLATMRRVCAADRYVRQGLWPIKGNFPLSYKVTGKRVGIVGLGRIGMAVAQRAEAFGCHIAYYSRNQKPDCAYHYYKTVLELAKGSDVLVITCALTKETTHIVNKEVIDALGPVGTVVNVARGPVIDEQELVKALVEGRLGAAGLDVFENEPYVPEELFPLENVVLLPHVGSATWETRREMANLVVQNLEAHFSGQPLLTPVH